eukprot:TRINITY_DN9974_c0_g1_i1.p1 TRINITY_DN9974_c0_g1~~TRINITY_DN9974_c0_g1_i1.p1  ORF type:complete len:1076 (+),score=228.23 TRINITY_DN9974_c0_g1_i1:158-3385(+)
MDQNSKFIDSYDGTEFLSSMLGGFDYSAQIPHATDQTTSQSSIIADPQQNPQQHRQHEPSPQPLSFTQDLHQHGHYSNDVERQQQQQQPQQPITQSHQLQSHEQTLYQVQQQSLQQRQQQQQDFHNQLHMQYDERPTDQNHVQAIQESQANNHREHAPSHFDAIHPHEHYTHQTQQLMYSQGQHIHLTTVSNPMQEQHHPTIHTIEQLQVHPPSQMQHNSDDFNISNHESTMQGQALHSFADHPAEPRLQAPPTHTNNTYQSLEFVSTIHPHEISITEHHGCHQLSHSSSQDSTQFSMANLHTPSSKQTTTISPHEMQNSHGTFGQSPLNHQHHPSAYPQPQSLLYQADQSNTSFLQSSEAPHDHHPSTSNSMCTYEFKVPSAPIQKQFHPGDLSHPISNQANVLTHLHSSQKEAPTEHHHYLSAAPSVIMSPSIPSSHHPLAVQILPYSGESATHQPGSNQCTHTQQTHPQLAIQHSYDPHFAPQIHFCHFNHYAHTEATPHQHPTVQQLIHPGQLHFLVHTQFLQQTEHLQSSHSHAATMFQVNPTIDPRQPCLTHVNLDAATAKDVPKNDDEQFCGQSSTCASHLSPSASDVALVSDRASTSTVAFIPVNQSTTDSKISLHDASSTLAESSMPSTSSGNFTHINRPIASLAANQLRTTIEPQAIMSGDQNPVAMDVIHNNSSTATTQKNMLQFHDCEGGKVPRFTTKGRINIAAVARKKRLDSNTVSDVEASSPEFNCQKDSQLYKAIPALAQENIVSKGKRAKLNPSAPFALEFIDSDDSNIKLGRSSVDIVHQKALCTKQAILQPHSTRAYSNPSSSVYRDLNLQPYLKNEEDIKRANEYEQDVAEYEIETCEDQESETCSPQSQLKRNAPDPGKKQNQNILSVETSVQSDKELDTDDACDDNDNDDETNSNRNGDVPDDSDADRSSDGRTMTECKSSSKRSQLSYKQREQIVHLHQAGRSLRDIAKSVGCTLSAVQYTVKKYARFRTIENRPKCGRTPMLHSVSDEIFFAALQTSKASTSGDRLRITALQMAEYIGHIPSHKTIYKEIRRRRKLHSRTPILAQRPKAVE